MGAGAIVIGIGLIGYGYWGPNLARNIAATPGSHLVAIAEIDEARRRAAVRDHPAARITADAAEIIGAPEIDAVVIATTPSDHRALAIAALDRGQHVLVEKPPATDLADARDMVGAAERSGSIFMVDHTFVFAPAVNTLAERVCAGDIGTPRFIESTRTNLARFDPVVGVIRDLAVHDLSILDHLLGRAPSSVSARGHGLPGGVEDMAFLELDYGDGLLARIHVSCASPVKIRRLSIWGERGLAVYDDMDLDEKIRIYQRAADTAAAGRDELALRVGYRSGTLTSPSVDAAEPLAQVVRHFIACVATGARPTTDGVFALRVLAVLDAAERSLARGGAPRAPEAA
jgi:predicted dehydrogenase